MMKAREYIQRLKQEDNYRSLNTFKVLNGAVECDGKSYCNLSSNDYLGISNSLALQQEFFDTLPLEKGFILSNPSSRLMTGNSTHYQQLEQLLASLYGYQSAVVFSSGYSLNSGVIPAITSKDSYIIADKLVHASIIDGIRLSEAQFTRFKHNDLAHLRSILEGVSSECSDIVVIVESIYSMDGDLAPLAELVQLKNEFGFALYVDEAHAFGIRGERGLGLCEQLNLIGEVDYVVATLGKAAASCGAFIVSDNQTRELIVNRCRTLIFSTAMAPVSLLWSSFIIEKIVGMHAERQTLSHLSNNLREGLSSVVKNDLGSSHIIPIIVGDNSKALQVASELRDKGIWATAIRYPTVAKGSARIRLSLNSSLSNDKIRYVIEAICSII